MTTEEALAEEADALDAIMETEDWAEGVRAFADEETTAVLWKLRPEGSRRWMLASARGRDRTASGMRWTTR